MMTMPAEPAGFGIAWRLSLCAVGFGLFFAPNSRLLIGRSPERRAAAAGGLLSTSRLGGKDPRGGGDRHTAGAGAGHRPLATAAFGRVHGNSCLVQHRPNSAACGLPVELTIAETQRIRQSISHLMLRSMVCEERDKWNCKRWACFEHRGLAQCASSTYPSSSGQGKHQVRDA